MAAAAPREADPRTPARLARRFMRSAPPHGDSGAALG
jgi:hypothetical protein